LIRPDGIAKRRKAGLHHCLTDRPDYVIKPEKFEGMANIADRVVCDRL
jgi:hypothetical protein